MVGRIKDSNDEAIFWLDQAFAYFESSQVLEESEYENKAIPLITLQSFSVECSLKCFLLCCNGTLVRGHGVASLFNKLPQQVRDDINVKFFKLHELDFNKCIGEIDNDFVDSRYFFEEFKKSYVGRTFSTGYLEAIARFLVDYAKQNEAFLKSFNSKV
ncbi:MULTISPECIES: HEPN domain-containing protein [Acinetobacter]|jgi:HEPN domain-containing protein|nr:MULTISPECIES: HEPN domain-containing protein [Acinetobacter]HBM1864835.1 HEPN domain-containing protein [Acinetobacter nosocomialis]MCE6119521.1 HEPN domain-containing protein [Acinetobacter baumannii]MCE6138098.1 HEPN domain-containing protein [Acinetobacter baumannii]MCG9241650.1 HEPN domain-containing protein [Acinetobacter baumannii]MCH7378964.1 HEPN domain-containing protein [Acinetobacter higginsii]